MLLDYITENDSSGTQTPNVAPVSRLLGCPHLGYLSIGQVGHNILIKA